MHEGVLGSLGVQEGALGRLVSIVMHVCIYCDEYCDVCNLRHVLRCIVMYVCSVIYVMQYVCICILMHALCVHYM